MTDTRPPYDDPRIAKYAAGWLVALGILVFGIVGLAVWDYNTDDILSQTVQTSPPP